MKKIVLFTLTILMTSVVSLSQTTVWSEDFEIDPTSRWSVSSGVWEMGVPTSGPNTSHGGTQCAATVLNGNYPNYADTRLFRLSYFTVPSADQNPRLRFWHWFSFDSGDYGKVQIHVQGAPNTDWLDISEQYIYTGSSVWTFPSIDLSAYAGQAIQIAFYLHSDSYTGSPGWYIDDISVVTGPLTFNNPESWETGLGDWYSEKGTWEVGTPTSGPGSAHTGSNCAATVLAGNYANYVDSRLICQYFTVPSADQNPRLRFWHWFSFDSGDYGKVQIHVQGAPNTDWLDISEQYIYTGSSVWTFPSIDLSAYAGQAIQIAFYLHSDSYTGSPGWYIDDISVVTGPLTFNNPESWETGLGDWYSEKGTWEVGTPTSGPGSAHTGSNCAATVLAGNYANYVDSRLICQYFTVPSADQNPRLRFWHWFSFDSGDYGKVQIHVQGAPNTDWLDISEQYIYTGSSVWTFPSIDLSAYAGQAIQIAFYLHSDSYTGSPGWYIDDISVVTGPLTFNNPESWETGLGDWYSEKGTWEVGTPTSGPGSAHTGSNCAATVLAGNYANYVDSRLICQYFTVPSADQNPRLRFWHWFSFDSGDYGKVQIHVQGAPNTDWLDISEQYIYTGSSVWTFPSIDLSAYAGQAIQIAFYLHSDSYTGSPGWYIDDISVVTGPLTFNNPESWETGLGDWYSEKGTWEVGTPTSGPGSAHTGSNCAATVLAGNYANYVDSRLISPPIRIPDAIQSPYLRFWHWYSFENGDYGKVMIKVEGNTDWQDISEDYINTSGGIWTYPALDLSAYAGQAIQIAFHLHSDSYTGSPGWYIDDISITGACTPPTTQASAFTSSAITSNSMTVGWTRGNGTGILVVARAGSPVDTDPVNGTDYAASSSFGSGSQIGTGNYVVYSGTGTSVNVTNISPGIAYHYAIYEYSTSNCYLTPALTGNATTLPGGCTLSVTPENQNVPYTPAGSTSFSVTSNCSWTASSDQAWCTVTPSGTGDGTITANYSVNTLTAPREANIAVTVSGLAPVVVTVTQAAAPCTLEITPANNNVPASPAGSATFTVTSNCAWTTISDQAWCTVTPSGTGNGTITADYSANTTAIPRTANITVTVDGVAPVVVTVTQAAASSNHFIPVWWPNPGVDHMNLYALTAKLDGLDLQPGDEIGVFDGDLCVGAGVLTQVLTGSNYLECRASADDPTTTAVDGYIPGHVVSFRVWDSGSGSEVSNAVATYADGEGIFTPGESASFHLNALTTITQEINLSAGWNIISFAAQPSDMNMMTIVNPLITAGTLVKIQDELGNAIEQLPPPIGWINNIGLMRLTEGYKIRVTTPTALSVTGLPVTLPYNIPFAAGWNIMGYPVMSSQNALDAFNPLITAGSLVKVQDELGNAIEQLPPPIGWIDNIHNLNPGKGYKIRTSAVTSLDIFAPSAKGDYLYAEPVSINPSHFSTAFSGNGLDHMNIYLMNSATGTASLNPGDEIGVFDGPLCVGAAVVDDPTRAYFMVKASLDDPETSAKDGFSKGHQFEIMLWNNSSGTELKAQKVDIAKGYGNLFEKSGTSVLAVSFDMMPENVLGDAYPNPSSGKTTFKFNLVGTTKVRFEIINVTGDIIRILVNETMPAGNHNIEWDNCSEDGIKVAAGVYFYRLKLNYILLTKKLIIN